MLNSYNRYNGTDTTSIEKGSPDGVITAANTTTTKIACFLNDANVSLVSTPRADKATTTVGNSNTIPNVSTVDVNNDIYEVKEKVFGTSGLT